MLIQPHLYLFRLFIPVFFLALSSCQTSRPIQDYQVFKEGQWSTYVRVTNKKKNSSHFVKMDIQAYDKKFIRLDITHLLKGHLASLVVRGEEVEYLLIPKKKFYSGRASNQALEPLLNLPLHPHYLYNLFFERAITGKGWKCSRNEDGLLLKCWDKKLQIHWTGRKDKRRKIIIDHPMARLQIKISKFKPKVHGGKDFFRLKKPNSFQHQDI